MGVRYMWVAVSALTGHLPHSQQSNNRIVSKLSHLNLVLGMEYVVRAYCNLLSIILSATYRTWYCKERWKVENWMRKNIGFLLNIHNRQFKIQMLVMHKFSQWFFYIVLLSWRTVTISLQTLSYTTTQNVKIKPPVCRIDPMQFGLIVSSCGKYVNFISRQLRRDL